MDTKRLLNEIIHSASDVKALDLVEMDVEGKSSVADFIVICHGTSTAHVKGISTKIEMNLKKHKLLPLGVEGYDTGEWILMDYNSVIVHIFLEEIRGNYQLEELYNPPRLGQVEE